MGNFERVALVKKVESIVFVMTHILSCFILESRVSAIMGVWPYYVSPRRGSRSEKHLESIRAFINITRQSPLSLLIQIFIGFICGETQHTKNFWLLMLKN